MIQSQQKGSLPSCGWDPQKAQTCTLASGKSRLEQSIIIKRAGLRNPINLWDVCLVVILNLRSYSKSLFSLCLQQFPDKFIIRSPLLSKQFSWSLQQSSRPISLILYLALRKKMSLLRCYAVDKEEVEVTLCISVMHSRINIILLSTCLVWT